MAPVEEAHTGAAREDAIRLFHRPAARLIVCPGGSDSATLETCGTRAQKVDLTSPSSPFWKSRAPFIVLSESGGMGASLARNGKVPFSAAKPA